MRTIYSYKKVEASDVQKMIEMYRMYLNDGESIADQVRQCYESDTFIGIKCVDESGEMCGVFAGSKGIRFTCEHKELVEAITERYRDALIYTVEMIVVIPKHRHQGIANKMVGHFSKLLGETEAQYLLVELWREPKGRIPGRVIIGVMGGEVEHHFYPEFYKDLPEYHLTCPICGQYCQCGADICLIDVSHGERRLSNAAKKEITQN